MQVSGVSGAGASAQLIQFGAQTTKATDLQVVTAEGDRVTISTSSVRTVGYAGVSGQSGDASVAGAAMQISGSDSVSMSVEGTLSRDELKDLDTVVKQLRQAATRGDASRLLDQWSKGDLDTLASVSASATTATTVTATSVTGTSTPAPAATDANAGPPAPPEPSGDESPEIPAGTVRAAHPQISAPQDDEAHGERADHHGQGRHRGHHYGATGRSHERR